MEISAGYSQARMVKKISLLVLSGALIPLSVSFAQLSACPASGPCVSSLLPMIHGIEMAAGLIFGGVAVISFLVAGVLFLSSHGEPEKIKQARAAVVWGVAGVVVGILAFSIIAIVISVVT